MRYFLLIYSLSLHLSAQEIELACPVYVNGKYSYSFEAARSEMQDGSKSSTFKLNQSYVIPTVVHVIHDGSLGKISKEQVNAGIEIINRDMNGGNEDWGDIDPKFDGIKSKLNLKLCLAKNDPEGTPTDGIIFHNDPLGAYNQNNIFQYAWDNTRYLNIYLPVYAYGTPSIRTAYATLPNQGVINRNEDGIVYSSNRWGTVTDTEFGFNEEALSIGTHELGHWLNLRHTFSNTCDAPGDLVDDTPATLGDSISFQGCDNFDFSCGQPTNGGNYMNYNHGCMKMFTSGQVDRMLASLHSDLRKSNWSVNNLIRTGCLPDLNSQAVNIYYNAQDDIIFSLTKAAVLVQIFDLNGKRSYQSIVEGDFQQISSGTLAKGLLFYVVTFADGSQASSKFISK